MTLSRGAIFATILVVACAALIGGMAFAADTMAVSAIALSVLPALSIALFALQLVLVLPSKHGARRNERRRRERASPRAYCQDQLELLGQAFDAFRFRLPDRSLLS